MSEGLEGDLDRIISVIEQKGLEGVVVKRRSSLYHAGKDKFDGWVKYRISEVDEFMIGGYMRRSDPVFDALVVGQYQNGKLLYKEKIRFGFDGVDKRDILNRLERLRIRTCPFDNLPQKKRRGALDEAQMRECTWVRPELWCEMDFPEWTNTGEIRGHGKFRQMIGRKQRAA
jgi:bifunctional non-homologous end joining protein LigD